MRRPFLPSLIAAKTRGALQTSPRASDLLIHFLFVRSTIGRILTKIYDGRIATVITQWLKKMGFIIREKTLLCHPWDGHPLVIVLISR